MGDQGDWVLELLQCENVGATQQEEPTREECHQGDHAPELLTPLEELRPEEPKVSAGGQYPQVEVDEVKGSEAQTEEYDRKCEACHHFFSSNMYRQGHVTKYHKALLRQCKMCMRWFMFPWDFDRHLDSQHRICKVCQWYLINDKMLQDHIELEHPLVADEPVEPEE